MKIKEILIKSGADAVGILKARKFTELSGIPAAPLCTNDEEKRINPFLIMPSALSIIVFLVSYNTQIQGNISCYAFGKDYHNVLESISRDAVGYIEKNGYNAIFCSDTDDLSDRHLAYLAGLGFIGKNHMLINPKLGSFTAIGFIITDMHLEYDTPLPQSCLGCNRCIEACPSDALKKNDFNLCLSYITQKKGELTKREEELIKENGSVWGCDICQKVCPHNLNTPLATHPDFTNDIITHLTLPDELSNREFKHIFGERAFSWRGKSTIERNLKLIKKD